jgi:hypothetical protein
MNDILNKTTVLVLNRNWQAIHVKTPAQAFCMMATDAATALDIEDNGGMRPVKWAEWLALPVREGDNCVQTVHGPVRSPTVIVLANSARVPKRRPKFSAKNIWQRDGATCQYTGASWLRTRGTSTTWCPARAAAGRRGRTASSRTGKSIPAKPTACRRRSGCACCASRAPRENCRLRCSFATRTECGTGNIS